MAATEPIINKRLWKSNFTYCQDQRIIPHTLQTTAKSFFAPPDNHRRQKACTPTAPAHIHHTDTDKIYELTTETKTQFYGKEPRFIDERGSAKFDALRKTTYSIHRDDHFNQASFKTNQSDFYYAKPYSKPMKCTKGNAFNSSVPFGDREKFVEWNSEMKGNFPTLDVVKHKAKLFSHEKFYSRDHHLGESGVLAGDRRNHHFNTTHTTHFPSHQHPNKPDYNSHPPSCVPFGDPDKILQNKAETRESYRPPSREGRSFETQREIMSKIFQSNHVHGDDRHYGGGRSMSKTNYISPQLKKHRADISVKERNYSSLPSGDMDNNRSMMRINGSITKDSYQPKSKGSYNGSNLLKTDEMITASNVEFGRPKLFSTYYQPSMKYDYQPTSINPPKRVTEKPTSLPMDYYKGYVGETVTNVDFTGKPRIDRPIINQQLYNKLKHTNIAPPRGNQFFSDTTMRSDFNSEGKPWRSSVHKDLQLSVLPIGTLGTYIEGGYNGYNGYKGYADC